MTTALATGRTGTGSPTRARVLVVAGPQGTADLASVLSRLGHEVQEEDTVESATAALAQDCHDLVFIDVARMAAVTPPPHVPVIAIGDENPSQWPDHCLGCVPRGAGAGVVGPLVALVSEQQALRNRCAELEALAAGVRDGSAFVGHSPVIRRLQGALRRAADNDATVLIEGARGTGKSLAARMIHCRSRRGNRPLVVESADTLDADALVRAFARARNTTFVVENVEQLPQGSQQLLVRHLKERAQARPGEDPPPRIIATTSAHLPEMVARGSFREDLYYRLHVFPIVMPSLRERVDDIALLANALLEQCGGHARHGGAALTPAAVVLLESMQWPGNVTQLESVVRRAYYAAGGAPIDREHLATPSEPAATRSATPAQAADDDIEITEAAIRPFDEEEQRLLSRALRATRGNVRRAAQLLGIGRATLYRKIQQYQLRLQ